MDSSIILAMFVSNLTPITIIAAAGGLSQAEVAVLLQNAMPVAGIATLIQLFPVWRIGSRLPIVMGVSFTFVTVLSTVAASYGYPAVIGAAICGGVFEGVIGLFARYWRKIIAPVVASSVVIAIGYSLFTVGARSFGGGYAEDFGSASNLLLGAVTLTVCLGWNILARGYLKQLSVLAGLVVGYILAVFMGKVDLSVIFSEGNRFPAGSSALCAGIPYGSHFFRCHYLYGFCSRNHRGHDCHGLWRAGPGDHLKGDFRFPGLRRLCFRRFCPVRMPSGDLIFPECGACEHDEGRKPLYHCHRGRLYVVPDSCHRWGTFLHPSRESVLGGCTIMMFGTIMVSGIQMLSRAGFTQRNMTIAALSLSVGIGFTAASEIDLWRIFPEVVQSVTSRQCGSCGVCRIHIAESDPAGGYGAGADPGVAETGGQAFRQPQN